MAVDARSWPNVFYERSNRRRGTRHERTRILVRACLFRVLCNFHRLSLHCLRAGRSGHPFEPRAQTNTKARAGAIMRETRVTNRKKKDEWKCTERESIIARIVRSIARATFPPEVHNKENNKVCSGLGRASWTYSCLSSSFLFFSFFFLSNLARISP